MAKRFTDTDKWKKSFIKSLPTEYKLFWLFIIDDCDNAGIWHVELEVAEARLGIKLSLEKIRGFFKERIVEFDGGTKMFIPDFVQFQYGSLNAANNAHKSVIEKLSKYNLLGLISPSRGAMDKDKEKDMDMVKEGGLGETTIFPIEHCAEIAIRDERFVRSNKTNSTELEMFNLYLEKQGIYQHNPMDYKRYFAKLKGKWPEVVRPEAKEFSVDELRKIAQQMDRQNLKTA